LYIDPTKEAFAAFQAVLRPGPIQMLNLVRFRHAAAYPDGRAASGAEAYRAYSHEAGPIFARVGGRQIWLGRFELTLIGPADERWDACFIAEYPDQAAFVAMLRDPAYREAVKHRQAAVEDSRLIRLAPSTAGARFGDA
jgi:uncharacterized protein (DUF1330 family)